MIDNAAEATIYGLEVDLEAQPTDALFLRGSLGLMENEFDEWSDDTGRLHRSQAAQLAGRDGQLPRGVHG